MKTCRVFIAGLVMCLLCAGNVFATATYYSFVEVALSFSEPFDKYDAYALSGVMGDGNHDENASGGPPIVNDQNTSIYQSVFATGWAGDEVFKESGSSYSGIRLQTYLTFNFSRKTHLTITLDGYSSIAETSTDLNWNPIDKTGESADSDAMLFFNNQPFAILDWTVGESKRFFLPKGEYVISIDTVAGGSAIAVYPSVPEPSTMLLLGIGMMGIVGIRRKLKN